MNDTVLITAWSCDKLVQAQKNIMLTIIFRESLKCSPLPDHLN